MNLHKPYGRADPEGKFTEDMPSWRAYTGQTTEECKGFGWLDAIHPHDRAYAIRNWEKIVSETGILNTECLLRSPDNKWRWTNIMAAPIRDTEGRVIKWVGANFDISRRKLAQEALKESEKKYRIQLEQEVNRRIKALKESRELEQKLAKANEELAQRATDKYIKLFNSIDEGFCIIEMFFDKDNRPADFRYLEVNPAFEKLTGIHNAEGRLISELQPELEDHWLKFYGRVVLTGKSERYVNKIKNHWYNVYAFKIGGDNSNNVAVLFSDVTEEIRKRHNMERALKVQDEVFANISHELKTPLNMIYSTNQLMELYLRNGSLDANRERIARNVGIIRQNCYRFTRLINNIVDMSRMDSGYFKLDIRKANIVETVRNIVDSISDYVRAKELGIVFETDVDEKYIACDNEKVERIMLNLISNAIKFTDPGGRINISVVDKGEFVEIRVRDTGIGIDQKYLDTIFLRYHQVNKTLTRNAEGSGIGLSLVKSIVEMHGGEISVESEPGAGSTFTVRLPAGNTAGQREADRTKSADSDANSKTEMINIEFSDICGL